MINCDVVFYCQQMFYDLIHPTFRNKLLSCSNFDIYIVLQKKLLILSCFFYLAKS